ncbi:MAG: GTP-binding protein [Actinomycetota bacterium]|nr:GTP-binding protein [Rubrobacter sp.]MDQ3507473.1 GTP-binding protein [Actinomycetota bacterium]
MKTPIIVVTGFLGSGKTTLLSKILEDSAMRNTAVLVNEFGEVGLDHHLLRRVDERTVLLGNGCVCCATRGDLVESLVDLLGVRERGEASVERVVVETTGLADPAPILFTIFSDPVLQHRFEVESVVATVDAVNGNLHLDANPEATKQIAAADTVVATKTDMAEANGTRRLISRIVRINPSARVIEASFGDVEAGDILDRDAAHAAPDFISPEPHDASETRSVSVTFDGAVDWAAFGAWLSMLLHARGEDILRVKGLLDVGDDGPVVLDGVQHVIHPPRHLDEWPDDDTRTRIVFIAKGIGADEIISSLDAFAGLLGAKPHRIVHEARARAM